MRNFHNILYASTGLGDDSEGLKQALSLARNNKAALKFLVVCPPLPADQEEYQGKYRTFMAEQVALALQKARLSLEMDEALVPVEVEVESSNATPAAISVIRHVLRHGHDLVIKEAEPREGGKGFMAMDMSLLRKCPSPVWLARPISRSRQAIRVAVAVNPDSRSEAEHDLSLRLLELGRSLADSCSGDLDIVSCWDFAFERYLRENTRVYIPEETMRDAAQKAQSSHHSGLSDLLQQSGIGGDFQVHRLKGRADDLIPIFVHDKAVDILVMGTVARTGIIGFIMGNTAENIMRQISCALVALKPSGFVSPVKAY
ncbi:universal stress protein [Desulfobulbus alkaliphilus]|nr:universal stress protein [Desulfobulbus alkaliphilus]